MRTFQVSPNKEQWAVAQFSQLEGVSRASFYKWKKTLNDKLTEKSVELNLKAEKLLQQLFGRKSERRTDGEGQLFLDFGLEATPEVVSALEKAIGAGHQV